LGFIFDPVGVVMWECYGKIFRGQEDVAGEGGAGDGMDGDDLWHDLTGQEDGKLVVGLADCG